MDAGRGRPKWCDIASSAAFLALGRSWPHDKKSSLDLATVVFKDGPVSEAPGKLKTTECAGPTPDQLVTVELEHWDRQFLQAPPQIG